MLKLLCLEKCVTQLFILFCLVLGSIYSLAHMNDSLGNILDSEQKTLPSGQ